MGVRQAALKSDVATVSSIRVRPAMMATRTIRTPVLTAVWKLNVVTVLCGLISVKAYRILKNVMTAMTPTMMTVPPDVGTPIAVMVSFTLKTRLAMTVMPMTSTNAYGPASKPVAAMASYGRI